MEVSKRLLDPDSLRDVDGAWQGGCGMAAINANRASFLIHKQMA